MRFRLASTSAIALLAGAFGSAAAAQDQPVPPEYYSIDERGVDLVRGSFNYSAVELTIGQPGAGGLTHGRTWIGATAANQRGWRDDNAGTINASSDNLTYTVSTGSDSQQFTRNATTGAFTEVIPAGYSLTQSGSTYTFISPDGTIATFSTDFVNTTNTYTANVAFQTSETRPDGEIRSLNYRTATYCVEFQDEQCVQEAIAMRLQSYSNSLGNMIHYGYAANDPNEYGINAWLTRTAVNGINLAQTSCLPLSDSCGVFDGPSVSYGDYDPSGAGPRIVRYDSSQQTEYGYTISGQLASIRPAAGSTPVVSIGYNENGRVNSVTDATGTWSYTYSTGIADDTTSANGPNQLQIATIIDRSIGRPVSISGPGNQGRLLSYDSLRRVTRVTTLDGNPGGHYVEYRYDARGNVDQTTFVPKAASGQANIVVSADFPDNCTDPGISRINCNLPLWTRDARGSQTDYQWSPVHGGLLTATAPAPTVGAVRPQVRNTYEQQRAFYWQSNGNISLGPPVYRQMVSSACANLASCANTADETRSSVTYGVNANLLPVSLTTAAGNGSVSSTTSLTYTYAGDVRTVNGPLPGSDTSIFFYDRRRRPIGSIGPDPDGEGPLLNRATKIEYNATGTVSASYLGAADGQTDFAFQTMALLQRVNFGYDAFLRPITQQLFSSQTGGYVTMLHTSYDASGRISCQALRMGNPPSNTGASSACAQSTNSHPHGPDRITQTTYSPESRVASVTTAVGTADASTTSFIWSVDGYVTAMTDGNGNQSSFTYDGFNRLVRLTYPPAASGQTRLFEEYAYDANGNVTTFRPRNNATVPSSIFNYTYDALNRLTFADNPDNVGDVAYTYNLFNWPLTASFPGSPSQTITNTWDALGRQLSETNQLGTMAMQYDAAGRRTRLTWPDTFFVDYEYDLTNAMTSIRNGTTTYAAYQYDNLARRSSITRANGVTTTYEYDAISRLSRLLHDFPGPGDQTLTYTYNAAGQILTNSGSNPAYEFPTPASGTVDYPINGLNQTGLDGVPLPYDLKGNLQGDLTRGYTYDQANRLRTQFYTTPTGGLSYDPLSRLSEVTGTQGARFVYDGNEIGGVAANTGGSNTLINRIIRGPWPDEVVAAFPVASTPTYLLQDHQGSTIALAGTAGEFITPLAYNEYGQPAPFNAGRFQYTGQLWLPDFQAYHYKARAYHPGLGRFMQIDPIGYQAGPNLYGYVGADPVNLSDSLGLQSTGPVTYPGDPDPVIGRRCNRNNSYCETQRLDIIDAAQVALTRTIWDVMINLHGVSANHYYNEVVKIADNCRLSRSERQYLAQHYSSPLAPGTAAVNGRVALAGVGFGDSNPIRQSISADGLTVTNQTLPGHVLHSNQGGGSVVRTFFVGSDNNLYSRTEGRGTNYTIFLSVFNTLGGAALFRHLDREASNYLRSSGACR
jgi:RHS repeat-associated protein